MSTHTATPWRYVRENGSPTTGQHMIAGAKPGYLAEVRDCGSGDVTANAEFIVRACNAHDDLVKALNAMLTHMGMDEDEWNKPTFDQARAAIAAAGAI